MTPKDRYSAVITGAAAAVITLAVAFGFPLTDEQRVALLGVIAPVVALVQAVLTRVWTTDDGIVVAKAEARQAVAGPASVYPAGMPLETVPTNADPDVQARLLAGSLMPGELR